MGLSTRRPGALYETFTPQKAKALWDRFELFYTPKHGSWLNVAEVELNVMIRQCLKPPPRLDRRPTRPSRRLAHHTSWREIASRGAVTAELSSPTLRPRLPGPLHMATPQPFDPSALDRFAAALGWQAPALDLLPRIGRAFPDIRCRILPLRVGLLRRTSRRSMG